MLVFLGGLQVPKWGEIDQKVGFLVMKHRPLWKKKHLPIAFGMITICQNTFPLNLPLFCDGKVFWQIENAGNAGKWPLKTTFHCKNLTKKPEKRVKTMIKAWEMALQVSLPMRNHFSEALVNALLSKLKWNRQKTLCMAYCKEKVFWQIGADMLV